MIRCATVFLLLCSAAAVEAQASPAKAAPATSQKVRRKIDTTEPPDAEAALSREEYASALDLFGQMAAKAPVVSRAGIIRTQLGQDKVVDARAAATAWMAEQPKNAAATEVMAEVLLRAGEPREAFAKVRDALTLGTCNARSRLTLAVIENLAGLHASAKASLEIAHKLNPNDPETRFAWYPTLPRAERIKARAAEMTDERLLNKKQRDRLAESVAHAADYSPKSSRPARTRSAVWGRP